MENSIKTRCHYPIPAGFLQAEERNGWLISETKKRVWAIQLDLMQKMFDVCKKHGLSIWADSGTLLGAVREKGFIPWDYDADLIMFRKDYDRLLQIASSEFKPPYFFQCFQTKKYYSEGYAQLRMDGTTYISTSTTYTRVHQGLFVDIFIMDEVPDDSETRALWVKELRGLQSQLNFFQIYDWMHPFRTMCRWWRHEKTKKAYEDCAKRYNDGKHDGVSFGSILLNTMKYDLDKRWYDETIEIPFEYLMIPVPKSYNEVLISYYGKDYMTPKPENHEIWKLDPDTDYHHYLPARICHIAVKEFQRSIRRIIKLVKKGHLAKTDNEE